MANHPTEGPGNSLPFSRSITPGPFLFRSVQPRRVLSGRISRRRSTSLPLTDLNREALWDEAVLQNQRLSSPSPAPVQPTTVPAYSLDAVPSLISSASSTPSTAAFDVFPCTEALSLSEAVTSLLPDPPLLSFDAATDFPLSIAHESSAYTSAYQHSYLESLFGDEKTMPSEEQTSYSGSFAPSPAMAAVSAMHSRATSAEPEHIQPAYSYPDYSTYPSASQAPGQPTYTYPSYVTQYAGSVDHRTYGDAYQHQAPHGYMPNHQSSHYLSHEHPATINPSETQGERPKEHKTEARCWEHGCNGRVFSTHSNLLRHMREKSGNASKSTCPKCGAQFTRKTAMRGHMNNDKCGKKSGYTTPMDRSP